MGWVQIIGMALGVCASGCGAESAGFDTGSDPSTRTRVGGAIPQGGSAAPDAAELDGGGAYPVSSLAVDGGADPQPEFSPDAGADGAADGAAGVDGGCTGVVCSRLDAACVMTRRIGCCDTHHPATLEELESDECLVLPGDPEVPWAQREECRTRGPIVCQLILACMPYVPFSEEAEPDGEGGCRFADRI